MHRVGSAGSNGGSVRTRKEKKLTYVLNDALTRFFFFFREIT
jgi:WD repeat-containing protein 48